MKLNLFRYFTFWFLLISLGICFHDYMGGDNKHILFFSFGLEPFMFKAVYTEPFRSMILDEVNNKILPLGYVLHIFFFIIYGILFDLIKLLLKKIK
ncbi:hypothetical protein [Bacillus sp. BP-3]|uniref:hypothetical protein n=1 Tax=Bacillus sp. BP-3 TaxID=3022773 RepID=UPI00232CF6D2|nr:hypothetical protein [Bacillus sp. BP-3]MDC2867910.1 hypothetical protein [Bacillus sp. BP-3]